MHGNEWKWKQNNNPKPVGHCKSSAKGKVHSNTGIPQETRKMSNNLTLHLKQLEKEEMENPRVRLFIWLFSCFLRYACIAMNFPLNTAFPTGFGLLCFHFHSFLCIFWFFWFLLWFVGYSEACCSASICWKF